jgi:carbon-monoxide dehydrogenase large subunit
MPKRRETPKGCETKMSGKSVAASSPDLAGELIGQSVPRVEDARLLRGQARFIDDIVLHDMLHAVFARSRSAHARITRLDTAAAKAVPGVHAVLVYADLRPLLTCERIPLALAAAAVKFDAEPICLVRDEATYVGEPVALVVADSRRIAEDAAALIEIDYDELPVVTDPHDGLQPGAPRARLDCPDNLTAEHVVKYGDVERVFAAATHRFSERFRMEKGGGFSIEPRGVIARYDAAEDLLTVWDGTQTPHRAKTVMVQTFGLAEHQLRVIAPDVGGGFGPKAVFHPEEIAIPAAARLLRRPVKWFEDRLESFTATVQERRQIWDVEVAFDADGKLGGIRGRIYHDHGANVPYGVALPYNGITNMIGPYVLPALHLTASLCLTNMVPVAPTRGAGRPQGTFVMERVLDRIAKTLNLSRDEVRRRNLIAPEKMPYATPIKQRDGSVMTYDSGDYPQCQRRALAAADWDGFAARRAAALREGRLLGIGLANYVEGTGRGPFESTALRIGASGQIIVSTGATAQGQGTKTMLAQLAGSVFGVSPDRVHVVDGDTAATPLGLGAFASRQAVTAGNAAFLAAQSVADKAKAVAAVMLEVAPEDLELKDGDVRVAGVPELKKSLAEIARALGGLPGFALPGNMNPGLAAAVDYQPLGMTYTNGTHIAEAEVNPISGAVKILRYTVVHDCGRMINPMMVEGQVRGGVVHGIGMTLFELMRFDESGQPLTGTLADYLLPTADVVPRIDIHHMESPTPLNPLGVKGAAESGTIGAPSVIVSAIEDALRPLDIRITELPILPSRLRALIRAAQKSAQRA